jgi:uracil-DNA glycosylase family 4
MDARERLRLYLEQRRELGESEFVLDSLPVDDVLRLIGDTHPAAPRAKTPESPRRDKPPLRSVRDTAPPLGGTWRETLTSIGAEAPSAPDAPVTPVGPPELPQTGIVIGGVARELMDGPLSLLGTLDAVASHVATCTACSLYKSANNSVPGEGNPNAGFVCVGEAPGQTEDELGRPFVGRAGELLTKILAAVQLRREDVFICNVLKHRPPGNRNPAPDEIRACSPYLLRQLELLRPRVILTLGTFASQTLLQTTQPIGKLRGQVHRFHGIPLIVTYHPAALLRNPAWKRPTWEDVQLARRIFDSSAQG